MLGRRCKCLMVGREAQQHGPLPVSVGERLCDGRSQGPESRFCASPRRPEKLNEFFSSPSVVKLTCRLENFDQGATRSYRNASPLLWPKEVEGIAALLDKSIRLGQVREVDIESSTELVCLVGRNGLTVVRPSPCEVQQRTVIECRQALPAKKSTSCMAGNRLPGQDHEFVNAHLFT